MCKALIVSRSGFYGWLNRPESGRMKEEKALKFFLKKKHMESRQTYGARRHQVELSKEGFEISRKRITRLMKENLLFSRVKKRFKITTDSSHGKTVYPNRLKRQFLQSEADKVYVSDITYIQTKESWLYLCIFVDLYSRKVVGWSMKSHMGSSLVTDALEMALKKRTPKSGLIIHSDRGSQYVSNTYQRILKQNNFIGSMSRKGNCWDNAVAESFFHSLKTELIQGKVFISRNEAKQKIFDYIEVFYNRKRLHSTLGYVSPQEFEERKVS